MKHKRTTIAFLFGLALPALVTAQSSSVQPKNFLWQVQQGKTTLYLMGSIHALKEDAYPLSDAIEKAFDDVQILVTEVDIDDMTTAAVKLMTAGTLESGKKLEEEVGAETWTKLEKHAQNSGFQASLFVSMKPWMAALTLTALELNRAGYTQGAGLDSYFFERAKATGKERIALETVEFQVGLFADMAPEMGKQFLIYSLRDLDSVIPMLDELTGQWKRGEVEPVEKLLTEGFEEFPVLFQQIVTDRNQRWMKTVEELLAGQQNAMVIVGSLHLVGEGGLVSLLENRGYTVKQL